MKFIQHVNALIAEKTAETPGLVLFGQNIAAGSHLSGLTKGLAVGDGGRIINTPNSENTLTGIGFGLMLSGVSSVFFMKQLDFLLLGVDHLVNTYNFIRRKKPEASFTIVPIISDLGYHGVQSSFDNFGDLASLARIPCFTLTNKADAEAIIRTHLVAPGFRIIGVPQRLFGKDLIELPVVRANADKTLFQYTEGSGATIACFNCSLPYGLALANKLKEKGAEASLFSVNSVAPIDWDPLVQDVRKTGKLVVLDDSKSQNLSCNNLFAAVLAHAKPKASILVSREFPDASWLYPNPDELLIDYDAVATKLLDA